MLAGAPRAQRLGDRPELLRAAGSSACQQSCLKSTWRAREHCCFSLPTQHALQVLVMQPVACPLLVMRSSVHTSSQGATV